MSASSIMPRYSRAHILIDGRRIAGTMQAIALHNLPHRPRLVPLYLMRLDYENAGLSALKSQPPAVRNNAKSPVAVGLLRPIVAGLMPIPAWAGETTLLRISLCKMWVYPRVGGGNSVVCPQRQCIQGLSPRGRGKLHREQIHAEPRRSIPAWAGETWRQQRVLERIMVYPRVGGGNNVSAICVEIAMGLSPRGRGKPAYPARRCARAGSIPAWAGETPPARPRLVLHAVYPRVGGGNRLMGRRISTG